MAGRHVRPSTAIPVYVHASLCMVQICSSLTGLGEDVEGEPLRVYWRLATVNLVDIGVKNGISGLRTTGVATYCAGVSRWVANSAVQSSGWRQWSAGNRLGLMSRDSALMTDALRCPAMGKSWSSPPGSEFALAPTSMRCTVTEEIAWFRLRGSIQSVCECRFGWSNRSSGTSYCVASCGMPSTPPKNAPVHRLLNAEGIEYHGEE